MQPNKGISSKNHQWFQHTAKEYRELIVAMTAVIYGSL